MVTPKFKDNKERIDWLVANKSDLISLKKSSIKCADVVCLPRETMTNKALFTEYKDDPTSGVIERDIIANTYNWLDSHGDVHVGKTFSKSIQERATKVFHLHDHLHQVTGKVGQTKSIQEVEVDWVDLGVVGVGKTTVLKAVSEIKEDLNKQVYKQYLKGEIDQHSVGMQYVKIDLAVNDSDYKEEFATWNKYINQIGNREQAEKQGYFYAVSEAKLVEYSAVLFGSNEITPAVQNIEPSDDDTQKTEPPQGTQIDWADVLKRVKL